MKNFTRKNFEKALEMVRAKGYKGQEAENYTIECFALRSVWNCPDVETVINDFLADALPGSTAANK